MKNLFRHRLPGLLRVQFQPSPEANRSTDEHIESVADKIKEETLEKLEDLKSGFVGKEFVVDTHETGTKGKLRLRSLDPKTGKLNVIGALNDGDSVTFLGETHTTQDSSGREKSDETSEKRDHVWFKIKTEKGTIGWVSAEYLKGVIETPEPKTETGVPGPVVPPTLPETPAPEVTPAPAPVEETPPAEEEEVPVEQPPVVEPVPIPEEVMPEEVPPVVLEPEDEGNDGFDERDGGTDGFDSTDDEEGTPAPDDREAGGTEGLDEEAPEGNPLFDSEEEGTTEEFDPENEVGNPAPGFDGETGNEGNQEEESGNDLPNQEGEPAGSAPEGGVVEGTDIADETNDDEEEVVVVPEGTSEEVEPAAEETFPETEEGDEPTVPEVLPNEQPVVNENQEESSLDPNDKVTELAIKDKLHDRFDAFWKRFSPDLANSDKESLFTGTKEELQTLQSFLQLPESFWQGHQLSQDDLDLFKNKMRADVFDTSWNTFHKKGDKFEADGTGWFKDEQFTSVKNFLDWLKTK